MSSSSPGRLYGLKINKLTSFFPRSTSRKGVFSSSLGPFGVLADLELRAQRSRKPPERVLFLECLGERSLPGSGRYAVAYPKWLIVGDLINFERNGKNTFIRTQFSMSRDGPLDSIFVQMGHRSIRVTESVVYQKLQGEVWVPIKVDGRPVES